MAGLEQSSEKVRRIVEVRRSASGGSQRHLLSARQ